MEQAAGLYYSQITNNSAERVSGFPMPELYNQHYINKYSFPKGLICQRKPEEMKKKGTRQSIYDMYAQPVRKGVSGWKLTKRIKQDRIKLLIYSPRSQVAQSKREVR